MDILKEVYLNQGIYYGKVSSKEFTTNESLLLAKYNEPEINIGGTITDGTVSYTLTSETRKIKSQSPFTQVFDPTTLSISQLDAGKRAVAFVNVITGRVSTAMTTLRNIDSTTNQELTVTVSV